MPVKKTWILCIAVMLICVLAAGCARRSVPIAPITGPTVRPTTAPAATTHPNNLGRYGNDEIGARTNPGTQTNPGTGMNPRTGTNPGTGTNTHPGTNPGTGTYPSTSPGTGTRTNPATVPETRR